MATVASVYAKASFELAQEKGRVDELIAGLRAFQELVGAHRGLSAVVAGAGVDPNHRRTVVREISKAASVTGVAKDVLEMLAGRSRLEALPEIIKSVEALQEGAQGVVAGEVRSAVELSGDEISVLSAAIAKRVGKKVRLTQSVDPSLLGGMVATVGGRTFDATLRSQLNKFRNELI
jgi:F-type H+-transporting ATPase subunit delta